MNKVESFQLDHRKVVAPYVRKCCTLEGEKGDMVSKYDLRFTQPNKESIPTAALHALEHLLAGFLRENIDGIIDLSPMGCRTGFYLTVWGDRDTKYIKDGLEISLKKVLDAKEVPAANDVQCGNYKDLSLFGAKEYAKIVLDKGFNLNIYGEK
ncbi:S-ribosylhomocysteine lyase [Clostridium tetanomorphum]|uniref:S-ribosylhomocysteine lyase n=1 Tax=Clostridium tetanomorphum TaxID=1553 RepID=A0A923EDD4_CLOTT|nr:S-ribosylhomocysteine lyase [Clostridium tetanomorphum]KAJ51052.1 S-ribosylhomocysteinase [Clostridium tetanomorphum DSM 665]MBC2399361.1 S-ribosylhomocysteine lyase [Clostridium tetanomorphum]MBP1865848.1 S-ribosylhomocysteine lyase [Clostridium tetanomorphum]NRS85297.1 S-ribosylhomocysteine lyase [Clostridium tetanomorphum]NRZ98476.1 S-ribosylhomocysteine lyase [Clostridium tetanomorphum]